ncbi:MAG: nucleotidyl transferase AbiEii/AbiGii toxin family protein [Candidatus Pacebacteria bacterium]|nr:nucleotidyl transferase AbiEii/AbiGii toxin family protein [Candidatus Paceibacterota bacterium]MDR3583678.1 nucleotidyl transferase AbiEii/AbiGii toxin family protein [Candidatus Paceibacterota bacterium]
MLDKNFLDDYVKKNAIPPNTRRYLAEYLQSEILSILYDSKYGRHLSFLGGTSLRFVYKIERFSEDLDFDLVKTGLDYAKLAKYLEKQLNERGFLAETRVKKTENIFIIFVKFSEIMKQMGVSEFANQKIKIKFEVDPSPYKSLEYETKLVSAYGKTFNVIINTLPTLFAQKILALKLRPYQKGRDFYDLVWFLAQKNVEPNYAILKEKGIKVKNREELILELEKIISKLDLKLAAADVRRFLFYPDQARWILDLPKYLDGFSKESGLTRLPQKY